MDGFFWASGVGLPARFAHKKRRRSQPRLTWSSSILQVRMKLLVLAAIFGLSAAQYDPHFKDGRTAIVHLFEWRWEDIALECERYLAPNGFGGVQVGPFLEAPEVLTTRLTD